jgi:hypothetical protein
MNHKLLKRLLAIMLYLFSSGVALSQNLDSMHFVNSNISYIADFNEDTYLDTLVSMNYNHNNYPYYILWANPNNLSSIKYKTIIDYPEYYKFKVSTNCVDMNLDNTLDLIFSVRYKVKVDSATVLDSAYNVIVFGQKSIAERDTLKINSVANISFTPYTAMNLNLLLFNKAKRDLSDVYSYYVNKTSISMPAPKVPSSNNEMEPEILIFPNPAENNTNLQISNLAKGDYIIRLLNYYGTSIEELPCKSEGGSVNMKLNLNNYASGSYFVILYSGTSVLKIYPFVIKK